MQAIWQTPRWIAMALVGWALLGIPVPSQASGDRERSPNAPVASAEPEDSYRRALELERQHKWIAAIELYNDALEHWPKAGELAPGRVDDLSKLRVDFRHRLRLCETHYRIGRRYQDNSFRKTLLAMPREQALVLYDEVIERIESQYVEPIGLDQLLRRGLDNLEVALRDPNFLQANAPAATPDRTLRLRESYRAVRDRVAVRDRKEARAQVAAACDLGRDYLGLPASAVALEFVYGATDALNDDYSSYLTPDKLDDLYAMIDGNFVGLGVELKQDEKGLRLVAVIPGGPAAESGLKSGDKIIEVNGQSVAGVGLDAAAGQLQGTEGSAVEITILHPSGQTQKYRLVRRPVEVKSVSQAKMIGDGVGYIQLTGFQKSSTDELTQAIAALQHQGLRHLVLDLRGNPGGLLNVAVELAERFVDNGVVVSTRGRAPGQSYVYRARGSALWKMPMTVLVDHDSASASEILAGALQDHHRAQIVGERSYGKGSVQSIFSLRSAPAGLKLTTAKFYSPKNRPYSEQGVEPDVPVHTVARPPAGGDLGSMIEFGQPDRDPVLSTALRQVRQQTSSAR